MKQPLITPWILYLGGERPLNKNKAWIDSAQSLIIAAANAGYPPCLVLLHSSDALIPWLNQQTIIWMPLPDILVGKRSDIIKTLNGDQAQLVLQPIIQRLEELQPQWGLSFYSAWIPPQIFSLPKQAFLNFHPGNLPELRGFEPDSWAILRGMQSIQGSVHRLTLIYDAGDLVWNTSATSIWAWDTPTSLIERVTSIFVKELPSLLSAMQNKCLVYTPQINKAIQTATRAQLVSEAVIDWQFDSHQQLSRRLRVFNGQNIGIPLQAKLDGKFYRVLAMELWRGPCLIESGKCLGYYQEAGNFFDGAPIIATKEGVALIKVNELTADFYPLTLAQLAASTPSKVQAKAYQIAISLSKFNPTNSYEYDQYGVFYIRDTL
ncbi:MAG TPA: formyltransferase family protein [Marinospirillum sp.]|uniref:formyltransferase family protein n=1 Tax=Marinospirillum sp. TaxID=2183934 RepID=UPI002B480523|nr:formyltransferase family protein [Marinospirillum sp.]HKM15835.1 formyltransferase family protein [Marinospirillum sp.]